MSRRQNPIARLLANPHRFGFHQAVRLLRRWLDAHGGASPKSSASVVRYRNSLSLAFPPSEIAGLVVHRNEQDQIERIDLTPAFIGLLGGNGALPMFYTELLAAREDAPHRDPAARAFLDIFQHRAVTLFHEAWSKHRLPLQLERFGQTRTSGMAGGRADGNQGDGGRGDFLPMALSFAGMGQRALQRRLQPARGGVADHAVAFYAGTLQQRNLGAHQLRNMLSHYFGVPVKLTQFVGRWFNLGESGHALLGRANSTLGSAVVGERVWQRDLRVRVTLGPLDRQDLNRFLPGAPGWVALHEMLSLATGVSLEYEVRLQLRATAVETVQLGGIPNSATSRSGDDIARLGWSTFLQSRASPVDRSEAGYDIHAVA